MGYGDLFVAGVLGGLLAGDGRSPQVRAAALTAALALGFDLLFFFLNELPATVPVALALIVLAVRRRRRFAAGPAARRREPARLLELALQLGLRRDRPRRDLHAPAARRTSRSEAAPACSMRRTCGITRLSNEPTASL